jgi:tetratricopeptide (TPR) repeat protein
VGPGVPIRDSGGRRNPVVLLMMSSREKILSVPQSSPGTRSAPARWPGRVEPADLMVLLTVVAAVLLALFQISDLDLYWHLKSGIRILDTFSIPRWDEWSHTARGGYYAHYSWLAEVAAALIYRVGGIDWVVVANALGCGLLMVILAVAARLRGARGLVPPWALLYGLVLVRFRFYARPEIFTLLLLPACDALCTHYLQRGKRRILWTLPVAVWFWANLHPFVIAGIGLIAVHAAGEWLGRRLHLRSAGGDGSPLKLAAAALASLAVSLANPYGIRIYTPAFKLFEAGPISRFPTREWLPPSWEDFRLFFILSTAATLVLLATIRRARLQDLVLWTGTLGLSYLALRNIGIFAVVSAPVLARHLQAIRDGVAPRLAFSKLRRGRASVVFGFAVYAAAVSWCTAAMLSPNWSILHLDQSRHYRFGTGPARDMVPVDAVNFIEEKGLPGPLLNSWSFGGYVIWRCWPRLEVSLDGRQMLYEKFMAQVQEQGMVRILDTYSIRLALIDHRETAFLSALRSSGKYHLVFFDDAAEVFVRSDVLEEPKYRLAPYRSLRPDDLSMAWVGGGNHEAGWPELRAEAERAVRESPGCARAWMMLGIVARRSGDSVRGRQALGRAVELDPYEYSFRNDLGVALFEAGEYREALPEFRKAVALDPRPYEAHLNEGLALLKLGRDREAVRAFRRVLARDPRNDQAHLILGGIDPDTERARRHLLEAVRWTRSESVRRKAEALLGEIEKSPK